MITEANKNKNTLKKKFQSINAYIQIFNNYRVFNKSAELAYYMMVGLLALLVTLVYAAHFIPNIIQYVDERVLSLLPDHIKDLILDALIQIKIPKSYSVIAATSITAIWFASRAMHSIMISFDELHGIHDHKINFKSKVLSIIFTLGLFLVFILMFILSLIQSSISSFLQENFSIYILEGLTNSNISLFISMAVLVLVFTLMYRYLPSRDIKWLGSIPGAIFTTTTWIIMSKGFTFYVNNVNNFSWILGSFGSIFVFLIWIYYSSLFILLGAMLNSIILSLFQKKKTED